MTAAVLERPLPTWHIEPVAIGPTWRIADGWKPGDDPADKYALPEHTLGWQQLDWIEANLNAEETDQSGQPLPFRLTPEQKRFLLWWYAVDDNGHFIYRDGVFQRLKGHGKDPLVAVICALEFVGPCRFAGWAVEDIPSLGITRGEPVAKENPTAWVQIAAVSLTQTKNTMKIFPGLFNEACKKAHDMNKQSIGKTVIYAHRGARVIEAVTSSPSSLEGNRGSFVVRNETHWWLENNSGTEMAAVIERNSTKSKGGAARALSITNAFEPGMESVAEIARRAYDAEASGQAISTGVLYDSLEVGMDVGLMPPEAKKWGEPRDEAEAAWQEAVVRAYLATVLEVVRGDSWWLDITRLTNSILSGENPPSRSRRFWLNQVVASEDAWVDPAAVDAGEDPLAVAERKRTSSGNAFAAIEAGWLVKPDEPIVAFFDGSKSDDSTAIVGCRISDGYTFLIGIWAKPTDATRAKGWQVDRAAVDVRVDEMFSRFHVVAFWGDPSHTQDDDNTRYWDGYIDGWHRRHSEQLDPKFWSVKTGVTAHSIMWDMTSPERHKQFVGAAELVRSEIMHRRGEDEDYKPLFTHDGHPALKAHLKNAKAMGVTLPGGALGVTIRKDNRESPNKIDIAACVIGSRMLRRVVLNIGLEEEVEQGGWVYTV